MVNVVFSLLLTVALFQSGYGLGCMKSICHGNPSNEIRACPDDDDQCGTYGGIRDNLRQVKAVDVVCKPNEIVYAPFDGVLEFWRPFGRDEAKCADTGVRIEGTGQWQGYVLQMSYVKLDQYGGSVTAGQRIGTMVDNVCIPHNSGNYQRHIRVQLFREGRLIDPTYHLKECMCTGQICESNKRNDLLGRPFKSLSSFNGVQGWELACPDTQDWEDLSANPVDPDTLDYRPPVVYAPIDAERIGRIRLRKTGAHYKGCDNDGIFLIGAGKWTDWSVRMYNVKFDNTLGLGTMGISQGQTVGVRLDCPEKGTNSIFLEVRRNGKLVNATDMILAQNCRLPS